MQIPKLRSPHVKVGGLIYFGRMLDKIRLHAAGRLPSGYNLGDDDWWFFDARCTRFLGVTYFALRERVLRGGADRTILLWCFRTGRKPSEEDIEIWNTFMQKRGWNDAASAGLEEEKRADGLGDRADIRTWFELFDADEALPHPPPKRVR